MHTPAKVCNLELVIKADQQVFWLDVSVDDMLGVAVAQGTSQRQHIATGEQCMQQGDSNFVIDAADGKGGGRGRVKDSGEQLQQEHADHLKPAHACSGLMHACTGLQHPRLEYFCCYRLGDLRIDGCDAVRTDGWLTSTTAAGCGAMLP